MGGGESPDIDMRVDHDTWSRAEIPTQEEMREGAENLERCKYKVDYMITHEPSQKIKNFLRLKDNEPLTVSGLNAYLQELSANCDFKCWFSAVYMRTSSFLPLRWRCSRISSTLRRVR